MISHSCTPFPQKSVPPARRFLRHPARRTAAPACRTRSAPDNLFRTIGGRVGAYGVEASFEGSLTVVRFPDGVRYEFASFGRGNQALVAQQDANGNLTAVTNGEGQRKPEENPGQTPIDLA